MSRIRFTQDAQESLLAMGKFIATQDQDLQTAMEVLDKIQETCNQFALFPLMGVARPELGSEVRCFFVYDYLVLYVPDEEGIVVLDIVHGSRDVIEEYRGLFI